MEIQDRIQLRVEPDGMSAWISLREGAELTRADFEKVLEDAGIVAGFDDAGIENVLRALAREAEMSIEVCIARGRPPQPGIPPSLVLNDPAGPVAGSLLEDGRLDFRERLLIVPVEENERLGHIVAGIPGKPGLDIHGEEILPEPLAELSVKHGEGVSIDDASGILTSTRSGARTIAPDDKIDVVDHHAHSGHVDLSSGHLKTRGSLDVSRDVTAGMTVHATADLKIGGTLDGGRAYAGGSIEIVGGAIGRESGAVYADGDLCVRHALGIRLQSNGRLTIARSVSTSTLVAREIEVQGKLLSDAAEAETRIVVKEAGSVAGGPCILRAAQPLAVTRRRKSDEAGDAGANAKESRRNAVQSLRERKGRRSRKGRKPRVLTQKQLEIAGRQKWRRRQRELQKTACIEVQGIAHAGCRIDFGIAPLVLEENLSATRFRVDPKTQTIISETLE